MARDNRCNINGVVVHFCWTRHDGPAGVSSNATAFPATACMHALHATAPLRHRYIVCSYSKYEDFCASATRKAFFLTTLVLRTRRAQSLQLRALQVNHSEAFTAYVSSFAAGAILTTSVMLLMAESMNLMASYWTEERDVTWRWGTMVIAGIAAAPIVDMIACALGGRVAEHSHGVLTSVKEVDGTDSKRVEFQVSYINPDIDYSVELGDLPNPSDTSAEDNHAPKDMSWVRVASSVLVGDFLHNFVDGIFIGTAFTYCGSAFGWTVCKFFSFLFLFLIFR
jgi:zinc transporter ZupT